MFAIGSSDKSIKMWKFKDAGNDEGENYESEDETDENMRTQNMDDEEAEREQQLF